FEALTATNQAALQKFDRVLMLSPNAVSEPSDMDEVGLSGLHAKLYIADAGWSASVWTGSANATFDAFERNVEFLVELTGSKARCGIDAFLRNSGQNCFADLLVEYTPDHVLEPDLIQEDLEKLAAEIQVQLVSGRLTGVVSETTE